MISLYDTLFEEPFYLTSRRSNQSQSAGMPVEFHEGKDTYTLTAEMAGIPKESINLTIHDNILHLQAEKEEKKERKDETCHIRSRRYGKQEYKLRLPEDCLTDDAKTSFTDGLLTVTFKKQVIEPKKLKIDIK